MFLGLYVIHAMCAMRLLYVVRGPIIYQCLCLWIVTIQHFVVFWALYISDYILLVTVKPPSSPLLIDAVLSLRSALIELQSQFAKDKGAYYGLVSSTKKRRS